MLKLALFDVKGKAKKRGWVMFVVDCGSGGKGRVQKNIKKTNKC